MPLHYSLIMPIELCLPNGLILPKKTFRQKLGLINEITNIISDNMHVNMRNLNFSTDGGTFSGKITVVVKNKMILKKLVTNLKKIEGIDKVIRI